MNKKKRMSKAPPKADSEDSKDTRGMLQKGIGEIKRNKRKKRQKLGDIMGQIRQGRGK